MTEPDKNLELLIHQRLRALPLVRAPKDLIPSVLGRMAAPQALAWWKRPWLEWPLAHRIVSFVLFAGALATGCWQQENISAFLLPSNSSPIARLLTAAGAMADSLAAVMGFFIHLLKNPWCLAAAGLAAALYLSVAALGTVFYRLAIEQPSNNK
jgi:hypothetical protein